MKSNKHILLLTPGFPRDEADSTCIPPLQLFVKGLAAAHPEATLSVITFQYPDRITPFHWHGITVYPAGGGNRRYLGKALT